MFDLRFRPPRLGCGFGPPPRGLQFWFLAWPAAAAAARASSAACQEPAGWVRAVASTGREATGGGERLAWG